MLSESESAFVAEPAAKVEQARARRRFLTGVGLLLGASVFWSLSGALIKLVHAEGRGPNGLVIAFYRSLFAGLFLLPAAWGRFHTLRGRGAWAASVPLRPAAVSCVAFFTLMTTSFVVANTKTEAANAIILQYTSTFWIFGLSPWIVGERPQSRDLWILALAVSGIMVIFLGNAATSMTGLLSALAAGLFFGLLTLMIRRMRDANPAAVTVLCNLGSAALIFPATLWVGGLLVARDAWFLLVILGVVQFGIPYYLYTLGLMRVPAYQAALITLVEPLLVPIWTFLAVGERVPMTTVWGGGIILFSLFLLLWTVRRPREQFDRQ